VTVTEEGTPQGAVISPLLANIYLHYVYDLWVHQWRHRYATGDVIVVRYADDTIVGFERRHEAEQVLQISKRGSHVLALPFIPTRHA
jgi:RNA-directed DNA polymerase